MRTTRFEFFADQLSSTEINTSSFPISEKFSPVVNATAFNTRAASAGGRVKLDWSNKLTTLPRPECNSLFAPF
jgi:hypothetical protein